MEQAYVQAVSLNISGLPANQSLAIFITDDAGTWAIPDNFGINVNGQLSLSSLIVTHRGIQLNGGAQASDLVLTVGVTTGNSSVPVNSLIPSGTTIQYQTFTTKGSLSNGPGSIELSEQAGSVASGD